MLKDLSERMMNESSFSTALVKIKAYDKMSKMEIDKYNRLSDTFHIDNRMTDNQLFVTEARRRLFVDMILSSEYFHFFVKEFINDFDPLISIYTYIYYYHYSEYNMSKIQLIEYIVRNPPIPDQWKVGNLNGCISREL